MANDEIITGDECPSSTNLPLDFINFANDKNSEISHKQSPTKGCLNAGEFDVASYVKYKNRILLIWTAFSELNWLSSSCREEAESVQINGTPALSHLLTVAMRDTHQSAVIARFLLNLYNGPRFPFDMTTLRVLDHKIFLDCITVLMMDSAPQHEIHEYFERGSKIWEQMAKDWGLD